MRLVVIGKGGQVDTALQELGDATPGIEIIRIGRPEIDLSKPETLDAPIRAARPDVIVSSAAYTAVDKAESEPDVAQAVNGNGPGELARISKSLDVPLLHLSTDYVFSGDKDGPYDETDMPAPVSVYGKTKLSGEQQIATETDNHVILRTAWAYSPFGENFVKTILRLADTRDTINVVDDQYGCPTYAPEIARAIVTVAQRIAADPDPTLRGIFHLTGQGETNWAEFAVAILAGREARAGKAVKVNPITTDQYPTPAKRPASSRLSGAKLQAIYGLRLDPWRVSLDLCLGRLINSGSPHIRGRE